MKFKEKDLVLDNCGCTYQVISVGRKYYTCTDSVEDVLKLVEDLFKISIIALDKRAKKIGEAE